LDENEHVHHVRVKIDPLKKPAPLRGMLMVAFTELPAPARSSGRGRAKINADISANDELTQQLVQAQVDHQAAREAMQTSQEELRSANEELQSANEELTTSREEMQSINQELQTVNAELQTQIEALSRSSDDMENLLNSTEIATLFLDRDLNVRRFTPRMLNVIKLIPGDVGRPITDLVSGLDYDLAQDAADVLRTLMFKEKEVAASHGRWFTVRTMPYRTQDNRIDGVVITFNDITTAKSLEHSLRQHQNQAANGQQGTSGPA
jgi:two-component system, chemotaxis family, CheB/CheR fusion protein